MFLARIYRNFGFNGSGFYKQIKQCISFIVTSFYPIYCKIFPLKKLSIDKNSNIIVSLTSYPARINTIHFCIQSILRQTMKPGKIILYLAKSDFPNEHLPKSLTDLKQYGLEIVLVDEDLKSYKKFYYAACKYPEKIIITADDDSLYPEDWVQQLYEKHKCFPNIIICFRAHMMTFNKDGDLFEYEKWNMQSPGMQGPSKYLVATGVGGILYPPNFFKTEDLENKIFLNIAPTADDLWLKAIELKNGYDVMKVNSKSYEWFETRNSQNTALRIINNGKKVNDITMKNLLQFYNLKQYLVKDSNSDNE